jgi:hypothetical protein
MPSLMNLPRELRDHILQFALLAETNQPPSLHQPFEELVASRKQYDKPALQSWSSLVLGDPSHAMSNATALLLVNRQLRVEIQEAMNKLAKQGGIYELDVVVLDEILPLTTWICVPFLTTAVEELNISIRISGSYDLEKDRTHDGMEQLYGDYLPYGSYKGFQQGEADGFAMCWQIYSILERFLRVGATHERTDKHEHKHIILKNLNINVETPPNVDPALFRPPRSETRAGERVHWGQPDHSVLHPDFLGNAIAGHITRILMGYNTGRRGSFTQCQILFEHMEYITVTKDWDTEPKETFDVAELLNNVHRFYQWDTDEERIDANRIKKYKNKAVRKRRERSLRVLVDMCPRCDSWNCWYFKTGRTCESPVQPVNEDEEVMSKIYEEETSDEYVEEETEEMT